METIQIGKNIAELRKARGITQETLARIIGVTPQAVSKWETGGAPDIELLCSIADYFEVPIDSLFGRNVDDYAEVEVELAKTIANSPIDHRFKKAFEYCWTIEKSLMGITEDRRTPDDITNTDDSRIFSTVMCNNGYSFMSLRRGLRYFLLMPKPDCGWKKEVGFREEYSELFRALGDINVLKTIYCLFERENKPFTPKLIEKSVGVSNEQATKILDILERYRLISTSEIELDDEIQTVYNFEPNHAFLGIFALCEAIIDKPSHWYYYSANTVEPIFNKDSEC